jgi:DNA-binding beta-propeller fold protein YncE
MTETPVAPVEETSLGEAVEEAEEETSGRKRRALLALLLLLFLCSSLIWFRYLTTRKPLPEVLPAAVAVSGPLRPHYLFSIYGVQRPVGVAVTPAGDRVYVTESEGQRLIHAFDADGNELFSFAPPDTSPATRAPVYIDLDETGRVFVSDRARHAIDIYDAGGNYQETMKPLTKNGWSPLGITFVGDSLYLTDVAPDKHRILEVGPDGRLALQFGREGRGGGDELWFPNDVVVDAQGRIYVSDSNSGRVKIFDRSGNLLDTIPGFALPRGMAIDDQQWLYVVDTVDHTVNVLDVSGESPKALFSFGVRGMGNGEFNYPNDIAIDGNRRLYIADRVNDRVQVWLY